VNNKLVNAVTLDLGSKYLGKLFLCKNFMFNYVFVVEHRNLSIYIYIYIYMLKDYISGLRFIN
jgi:hypothetical protein